MNLLGLPCKILGIINLTCCRQFKQNIRNTDNEALDFLCGKPPQTMEIKKPRGLRPINLNPLFEIKSHRFTWPLYSSIPTTWSMFATQQLPIAP